MTRIHSLLCILIVFCISCHKSKEEAPATNYGSDVNTWTFQEGNKTFYGTIFTGARLKRTPELNNDFIFNLAGNDTLSGNRFVIGLSLLDSNFTTRVYRSGIPFAGHYADLNYFVPPIGTNDAMIYKSSNFYPGAVITYTFTSYDAASQIITLAFSGQATGHSGNLVTISNGKLKAKLERY
jgi:hypothetical protein